MQSHTFTSLTLLLLLTSLISCSRKGNLSSEPEKPLIAPPLPGVDVSFECHSFDAEEGTLFSLANGTRIVIPPASLVDQEGRPVAGEVELAYREFHDATDILLSGIPMDYDSAGATNHFETAGMFEIEVIQNGHPVFLASGNQAQVNMASFTEGDDYNFYFLDKNKRNWQYEGQREAEVNFEKVARKEQVRKLKRKKPFLLRKGHFVFDYMGLLDIYFQDNYDSINSHYQNEAIRSNVLSKAADYGLTCLGFTVWEDIKFLNSEYPASMMVWKLVGKPIPSWADSAYRRNLTHLRGNIYQLDLKASKGGDEYRTQIKAVMPIRDLFKVPSKQWKQERKAIIASIEREETRLKLEADILRSFEIRKFGIYNWDRYAKTGPTIALKADFDFGKFKDTAFFNPVVFYLPGNERSVVKYPKVTWKNFRLPDDNRAKMVCVLPQNRVAVYSPAEFAKIDLASLRAMDSPEYVFEMKVDGKSLTSAGQLRGTLGM